ncbi:MAG: ABC transporter ATP-binding protein, partial [Pseudoflavonifractor sp.]
MSEEKKVAGPRRGPMGGHGPGGRMMPGEKAKNFKGTIGKLLAYMGRYKIALVLIGIFAIGSTAFSVIGPKIMGQATSEIFAGLMAKMQGSGGINFGRIGQILIFLLCLYLASAAFSFVQGWLMSGISQKMAYRMRREISEKIHRMPMKYFESKTVGEVLSRITNDVDTMGQSLNQSVTQLITSVTMLVGVFIMMLTISPLMTLIAVVILPVSMLLISLVVKHSQKFFKAQQAYLGTLNGQVEEIYSGHNVVKAFNREEEAVEEFEKTNHQLFNSGWKSQFFSGMMQPIMN